MDHVEVLQHYKTLTDGQTIRVTTASGRTFDGVYDGEATSIEEGLYFESFEGQSLHAEWEKVTAISYRSARMTVGSRFTVPPEHPLSGKNANARAYTARNPIAGAEED